MKNNFKKTLKRILKSKTVTEEVASVNNLIIEYKDLFNDLFLDNSIKKNTETIINGGIALSLEHARDCLEDPIRTARFLKGTYKAILYAQKKFPKDKINILYAGCGPLGTLIVPLLHLFSSDKVEVILLDIHQTSIDSVKKIVKDLSYEIYIKKYLVADATSYKHIKDDPLHVIISETMDKGLTKEPQVEITRNLGKQLIDGGIFIPEKIEIEKGYSFFAKEIVFNSKINNAINLNSKLTIEKEKLFSITSKIESTNSFFYETNWIFIPSNFEKKPDICLYTKVTIFDDIQLGISESYITNPISVKSLYTLKTKKYKLRYSTEGIPNWKVLE